MVAALVFLGCMVSPPSLMDDVDAVQAQIARNMLQSGDWVTARLDGIPYLEKSPLKYWMMAISFAIFGAHDWAARIPLALSAIALSWLTMRFGAWAFGRKAGFYAGLILATSVGLFLFRLVKGWRAAFEQTRVNDEVWLPRRVQVLASARLGLLKVLHFEQEVIYTKCREFQAGSIVLSTLKPK